jgi:hypothetical protein
MSALFGSCNLDPYSALWNLSEKKHFYRKQETKYLQNKLRGKEIRRQAGKKKGRKKLDVYAA